MVLIFTYHSNINKIDTQDSAYNEKWFKQKTTLSIAKHIITKYQYTCASLQIPQGINLKVPGYC